MIDLTQTLIESDYKAAAAVHFKTYRSSKYRPWLGIVLICLGIFLLAASTSKALGMFGVGYGIYMFCQKHLYVGRLVKSVKTAKGFGDEIRIHIDEEGVISSEQGGDRAQMRVDRLFGFIDHPIGVLLYPQRNLFYYLKADAFESTQQRDALRELLKKAGIKQLKA